MRQITTFIIWCLMILCNSVTYSQKISAGLYSGVNFSDIHGQNINGKWSPKAGPVQGLFIGYSFNKSFGIQSGINYSTIYYEHEVNVFPIIDFIPAYGIIAPNYFQYNEKFDFTYLRIPLLFTVTIPSAVKFEMRAGLFLSLLQNNSLNINTYYNTLTEAKPEKTDIGYILSSGLSYPLTDHLSASFNAAYMTGRKRFLKDVNYRHGSSEFTIGVAYTGLLKAKNAGSAPDSGRDSSRGKVEVIFRGGMNYSWNSGYRFTNKYSPVLGPSFGFYLNFPLKSGTSFQTGISFERKGYSLKDSSAMFYKYILNGNTEYNVDTKIQLDYAVIPVLINFYAGKNGNIHINTGPWIALKLNARNVGVAYDEYRSGSSYLMRKTVVYDDLEKIVNNYDLGWIFGGGVSVPVIKNYNIDLDIQYSAGSREVFNKSGLTNLSGTGAKSVIKTGTVSFIIGLKIPSSVRLIHK